jgi:hypothetical protein
MRGHGRGLEGGGGGWGGSSATLDLRAPSTAWGGGWGQSRWGGGRDGVEPRAPSIDGVGRRALMAASDDGDRRVQG